MKFFRGVAFFHWFFPFFFNVCGTSKNPNSRPHPVWWRCFRLHSCKFTSCQPFNGKNCFFLANLPKGIMTKIRKGNGRLSTVDDFFSEKIGNSTSTISYEFQTSKGFVGFVVAVSNCQTKPSQVRRFGAPVWSMFRNPKIGPKFLKERPKLPSPPPP